MFNFGTVWWEIGLRTTLVYVAVLLGLRLTGKRQIGQMAPFDLVLILLIANAVQNAMVGPDTSLVGGLVAAGVLLGLNLGVARLNQVLPLFRRLSEGMPAVLILRGQMVPGALSREGIDQVELEQAIREHGLADVSAVEMAVLEVDGSISIVPKDQQVIRAPRRFRQVRHN